MRDINSRVSVEVALNDAAIVADTTTVGNIIDLNDSYGCDLLMHLGTIVDGTYTGKMEHGDDAGLSDATDVTADHIIGALPVLTASNTIGHVGYAMAKRYVRLSIVSTVVTTGGDAGGSAVLSKNSRP